MDDHHVCPLQKHGSYKTTTPGNSNAINSEIAIQEIARSSILVPMQRDALGSEIARLQNELNHKNRRTIQLLCTHFEIEG